VGTPPFTRMRGTRETYPCTPQDIPASLDVQKFAATGRVASLALIALASQ